MTTLKKQALHPRLFVNFAVPAPGRSHYHVSPPGNGPARLASALETVLALDATSPVKALFDFNFTRIRDHLRIDQALQDKLSTDTFPGDVVTLVARIIDHVPGFDLILPGRKIRLVASDYQPHGGKVVVSGKAGRPGSPGHPGKPGHVGTSEGEQSNRPGEIGETGVNGENGKDAGTIDLLCERTGVFLFAAVGGSGGPGGNGGAGGRGGRQISRANERLHLHRDETSGGPGGKAADGGNGGRGGQVSVSYVSRFDPSSILGLAHTSGGLGGPAGLAGPAGRHGARSPSGGHGRIGLPGRPGVDGSAGKTLEMQITPATYWEKASELLGSHLADWAQFRLEIGKDFSRAYHPLIKNRQNLDTLALREFEAVLQLLPGQAEATFRRQQLLARQHASRVSCS